MSKSLGCLCKDVFTEAEYGLFIANLMLEMYGRYDSILSISCPPLKMRLMSVDGPGVHIHVINSPYDREVKLRRYSTPVKAAQSLYLALIEQILNLDSGCSGNLVKNISRAAITTALNTHNRICLHFIGSESDIGSFAVSSFTEPMPRKGTSL